MPRDIRENGNASMRPWQGLMDEYQAVMQMRIDYSRTPVEAIEALMAATRQAGAIMAESSLAADCADAISRLRAATSAITRRE